MYDVYSTLDQTRTEIYLKELELDLARDKHILIFQILPFVFMCYLLNLLITKHMCSLSMFSGPAAEVSSLGGREGLS